MNIFKSRMIWGWTKFLQETVSLKKSSNSWRDGKYKSEPIGNRSSFIPRVSRNIKVSTVNEQDTVYDPFVIQQITKMNITLFQYGLEEPNLL